MRFIKSKDKIEMLLEQAEYLCEETIVEDDSDFTPVYELLDRIISLKHDCSKAYLLKASLDLNILIGDLYDSDEPLEENSNFLKAYLYANDEERAELKYQLERNQASIECFDNYNWKAGKFYGSSKVCPQCHKEIPVNSKVCPFCGKHTPSI